MARELKEIAPIVDGANDNGINFDMGGGEFLGFSWTQLEDAYVGGQTPSNTLLANIGIDLYMCGIDPTNRAAVIQHFGPSQKYKMFKGSLMALAPQKIETPTKD